MQQGYRDLETPYQAFQPQETKGSKRKIITIVASLVGLAIVGGAIGVGVYFGTRKTSAEATGGVSSSGSSSSAGGGNSTTYNPNDPSDFAKDSRLHQVFYGLAYTPEGSQLPNCGNSLDAVIQDIQILSQLTTRIRLYGADCNQTQLVLEAIKQTKTNITLFPANYPVPNDNGAAYTRQKGELQDAITKYGVDHIGGITVGNEFILDYLTANGGGDNPNGAVGDAGAAILIPFINDTRAMLKTMNLNIPVGNSDAGSYFNTEVLEAINYGQANVHPWFANVSAQQAAAWTAEFFLETNVQVAEALPNKPQMSIAETGWPTQSSDVGNESNGPSTASEANLQIFLDTFVCQANANGTEYFFFEALDEPWKDAQFGGVEGWWGLFHSNRTLKNIEIPTCT